MSRKKTNFLRGTHVPQFISCSTVFHGTFFLQYHMLVLPWLRHEALSASLLTHTHTHTMSNYHTSPSTVLTTASTSSNEEAYYVNQNKEVLGYIAEHVGHCGEFPTATEIHQFIVDCMGEMNWSADRITAVTNLGKALALVSMHANEVDTVFENRNQDWSLADMTSYVNLQIKG